MPKPIKKRIVKTETSQEDVQEIMSRLAAKAGERKKQLLIAGIIALVVILIASGSYIVNKNSAERAALLEAEGFKLFTSQREAASMPEAQRLEGALRSFREANSTRSTAFRQYYIAATLFEMGRYEECLAALDEMDSRYSSNKRFMPISKLKRAMTYRSMGNIEQALTTLQEFNFLASKSLKDVAFMEIAEILESAGREDEAQQYYTLMLKEYPSSRFASTAQSRLRQPEGIGAFPLDAAPLAPDQPEQAPSDSQGPLKIDLK